MFSVLSFISRIGIVVSRLVVLLLIFVVCWIMLSNGLIVVSVGCRFSLMSMIVVSCYLGEVK